MCVFVICTDLTQEFIFYFLASNRFTLEFISHSSIQFSHLPIFNHHLMTGTFEVPHTQPAQACFWRSHLWNHGTVECFRLGHCSSLTGSYPCQALIDVRLLVDEYPPHEVQLQVSVYLFSCGVLGGGSIFSGRVPCPSCEQSYILQNENDMCDFYLNIAEFGGGTVTAVPVF